MSSFIELITEILRLISSFFNSKKDEKANLWEQIEEKQKALIQALESGKLTDAGILNRELQDLMTQYSRTNNKTIRTLKRCAISSLAVISLSLLSGCAAFRSQDPHTVFIEGERINIVEPGQEIVVPQLITPAKKWYLVDNIGLQYWLGISTGIGSE